MKTLDTTQTELVARSSLAAVQLVKIAPPGVVPTYISSRACMYDYENTGTDQSFNGWLSTLTELRSSIVHMSAGDGSGVTDKTVEVVINNLEVQSSRVAAILATGTLEGASIEIAELLMFEQTTAPMDLTANTGDEHTMLFRGVINRVLTNNTTVTLECSSDIPTIKWATINDASKTRPKDVGARYPIPYGKDVIVPLVGYDVSWSTSITTDIPSDSYTGTFGITNGAGFPASGTYVVGAEIFTATKTSDTVMDIVARAQQGTQEEPHKAGMPVSEVRSDSKWIVSRYPISGVKDLFYRNPLDGKLVRIPTGFTFTKQDTEPISGEWVSTIKFPTTQQYQLAAFIAGQQYEPSTTPSFSESTTSPQASGTTLGAAGWDGDENTSVDNTNVTLFAVTESKDVRFAANASMTAQTVRMKFGALDDVFWLRVHKGHDSSGEILLELPEGEALGWHEFTTEPTEDDFRIRYQLKSASGGTTHLLVYEVERIETEQDAPASYAVPTEIAAATLSLDLELYARVDGVAAPGGDVVPGESEAFNPESGDGLTWVGTDGVNAITKPTENPPSGVSGDSSLRADFDGYHGKSILDCSDGSSWDIANATLAFEGSDHFEVNWTFPGSEITVARYEVAGWGADLTDDLEGSGHIGIHIYHSNPLGNFRVRIGKGATGTDHDEYLIEDVVGFGHRTIWIDRDGTPDGTGGTGWDYTDWNYIAFIFNNSQFARFEAHEVFEIREKSWVQCNAMGSLDFSTGAGGYNAYLHAENAGLFSSPTRLFPGDAVLSMYISDDNTVTGTSLPTDWERYDYTIADPVTNSDWKKIGYATSDTGGSAIDNTDINYMRLELSWTGAWDELNPRIPGEESLWVDVVFRIDAGGDPVNDYTAADGEALELPTDIALHWIELVGGALADTTTLAEALTNLDDNILAGDARGWGATWAEVLDQIAMLSRANFISEETATSTRWKMLTADSAYSFGASQRTLTMFQPDGVSEGGRDQDRELASGRTTLYAYEPYISNDEAAFTQVLRIGSDQNDSGGNVSAAQVTAATSAIGQKDAPVEFFLGILDEATAQDIASWRYLEGSRFATLVVIEGLSWSDGYSLECGDIVTMTRPYITGSLDLRLIEVTKDFATQRVEIRGVEV